MEMAETQTEQRAEKAMNGEPRIKPIERPKSLKLKLAYYVTRKKLGKAITPLKVVQARLPETLPLAQQQMKVEQNLSLPDELVFFIKSYIATLNGCTFCIDIAEAGMDDKRQLRKYDQLLNYDTSPVFSDAEKAALRYAGQATLDKEVSEDVFNELRNHYTEKQIVEITWLNALENYYNLINKPLGIGSDELCNL